MIDWLAWVSAVVGSGGWGSNPLERLPTTTALISLAAVWVISSLCGLGGTMWCASKPTKEELWPILRASAPPVPWWVLRTFYSLGAFPCLFLRYLNLLWAERTAGVYNMLHWSLLTGAVCLAVCTGRWCFTWLMDPSGRSSRYRAVLLSALLTCAAAMLSTPLLAGLLGGSRLQWTSVACSLLAAFFAGALSPAEALVLSVNQDWSEYGTPRTTTFRRLSVEYQRQYAALGAVVYTILAASALQFTAAAVGDLVFTFFVGAAAVATVAFYEACVPHATVEALRSDASAAVTPRPSERLPDAPSQAAAGAKVPQGTRVALAHAVLGAGSALGSLLFAVYAMQELGLPIWLVGAAYAAGYASEAVVLWYDGPLNSYFRTEVLWLWGAIAASLRLALYTLVTAQNGLWLLPVIEATHGLTCGVASGAAGRILRRKHRPGRGEASVASLVLVADGNLAQAVGCVFWGLVWHYLGFRFAYLAAAGLGALSSGLSATCLFRRQGNDEPPSP